MVIPESGTRLLSVLRDGAWLTRERIWRWAGVTLACAIAFELFLIITAHGPNDFYGRPLGTDFSSFYAAGQCALNGLNPYDRKTLYGMQQALFGSRTPYYSFAYPPFFLILTELLARLPYAVAFSVWQGATFALYLSGMAALRRRLAAVLPGGVYFVCAAAFTAVILNFAHGQTAFFTAALFSFGIALLGEQPYLAGAVFGLLAIKPQFGILLPFALAAGGNWRSVASAAVTVTALCALATGWFGVDIWAAFFSAASKSRHTILDLGGAGYERMISVFAWARLWRLPLTLSYAVQVLSSLLVIMLVSAAWRGDADIRLKGAALCAGALLVTPFALDYDMMVVLAPAITLLALYGYENPGIPFLNSLLSLLWIAPLFVRAFSGALFIPLGPLCAIGALFLALREVLTRSHAGSAETYGPMATTSPARNARGSS